MSDELAQLTRAARAAVVGEVRDPHAPEQLRVGSLRLFSRVPEVPLYRRRDDPSQARAQELLPEVSRLLTLAYGLEHLEVVRPWLRALEAHAAVLARLAVGRLDGLEALAAEAWALEQAASQESRLFRRAQDVRPPVYDPATGRSRFDPAPEAAIELTLLCPWCRRRAEYRSVERVSHEARSCPHCQREFFTYLATLQSTEVLKLGPRLRRYRYRLDGLAGEPTLVEVDDGSEEDFSCARRDLLAFLYAPFGTLRGVLNLSASRVLWLSSPRACFVATVALGEGARELDTLRAFRDEVLAPTAPGRAFIDWYYRRGPSLAEQVRRRPRLVRAVRAAVRAVVPLAAWSTRMARQSARRPTGPA